MVDASRARTVRSATMYNPAINRVEDPSTAIAFLQSQPSAQLVTVIDGVPTATRLPVIVSVEAASPDTNLVTADLPVLVRGHLAAANPQARSAGETAHALMIFDGPEGYVSPSNYAEKAVSGKVVPTWNYAAAHITGELSLHPEPEWLLPFLHQLTDTHEGGRAAPWSVDDAPAGYIDKMLRGIVGVEIRATTVEVKYKLSQNKPAEDQRRVAEEYLSSGNPSLGELMTRARN